MAFWRLIVALYRASSVITVTQDGKTLRFSIDSNMLVDVVGHSVHYADGLLIRKGKFAFDQPAIQRAHVTDSVEAAVYMTVSEHETECRALDETPAIRVADLALETAQLSRR